MPCSLKCHQPIPAHIQKGLYLCWFQQDGNYTWFLCPWASCTAFTHPLLCLFWLSLQFPHTHGRIFPSPLLPLIRPHNPLLLPSTSTLSDMPQDIWLPYQSQACPTCLEAPQARFTFAACLCILIRAHSCSLPGELGNGGGQVPNLLFGRERICWGEEQLWKNTSFPRQIRVIGKVPTDTKEQQCADSMTLLSPGERLTSVIRRLFGFICTFSQGMGEKMFNRSRGNGSSPLHSDWKQPQSSKEVRETYSHHPHHCPSFVPLWRNKKSWNTSAWQVT